MKKLLLIFSSLICCYALAQKPKIEKPDYKRIFSATTDKDSKSFYPVLLDRYNKFDTSLTNEEFRLLYFGFLFQAEYSPYPNSVYNDSLGKVFKKESLSYTDYETLIKYEKLVLKEFPFNLRDLNVLANSYQNIGDIDTASFIAFRLTKLIHTILSTGNGEKEKTAWHVISVGNEYDILSILGYEFGGEQFLTKKGCDFLKVSKNKDGKKGFYFDVNKLLEAESIRLKNR
jgi:hypothetical protein